MIGVQLQTTTLYDKIRVGEVIRLFGSFYRRSLPAAGLLEEVSLTAKKDSYVNALTSSQNVQDILNTLTGISNVKNDYAARRYDRRGMERVAYRSRLDAGLFNISSEILQVGINRKYRNILKMAPPEQSFRQI